MACVPPTERFITARARPRRGRAVTGILVQSRSLPVYPCSPVRAGPRLVVSYNCAVALGRPWPAPVRPKTHYATFGPGDCIKLLSLNTFTIIQRDRDGNQSPPRRPAPEQYRHPECAPEPVPAALAAKRTAQSIRRNREHALLARAKIPTSPFLPTDITIAKALCLALPRST